MSITPKLSSSQSQSSYCTHRRQAISLPAYRPSHHSAHHTESSPLSLKQNAIGGNEWTVVVTQNRKARGVALRLHITRLPWARGEENATNVFLPFPFIKLTPEDESSRGALFPCSSPRALTERKPSKTKRQRNKVLPRNKRLRTRETRSCVPCPFCFFCVEECGGVRLLGHSPTG